MLGYFAACPTNAAYVRTCSTVFSRGRGIMLCSPSLCTVRFSFSQHPVGSRLSRLVPCTGPPPSLSFPSSFGDTTACTPTSSSGPPFPSFISPSATRAGSAPCLRPYLHSMHRLCIPSPSHLLPVCCAPPPFTTIKYPWSLLFFFIPIHFNPSIATRSSRHCEARFVSPR